MKSSWNADRADFLITSGVWNMTSIQELFITGSVVFASRLVNFQHQQEIYWSHKLRHFFGQILMNLIYLNQYIRKDSVSCPEKEEILVQNSNQTIDRSDSTELW